MLGTNVWGLAWKLEHGHRTHRTSLGESLVLQTDNSKLVSFREDKGPHRMNHEAFTLFTGSNILSSLQTLLAPQHEIL